MWFLFLSSLLGELSERERKEREGDAKRVFSRRPHWPAIDGKHKCIKIWCLARQTLTNLEMCCMSTAP